MFFDINSKTRNEAIKLYEKLNIIEEEKIELNEDQKFKNLKIYCTGKFANFNKKQLEDIVKKNGGIYANGYNKKLDYFEVIVDLNERDQNGKPIFSAEKVMKEVSNLTKVHQELVDLENAVKKELTEQSTLRAGAVEDFDPGVF